MARQQTRILPRLGKLGQEILAPGKLAPEDRNEKGQWKPGVQGCPPSVPRRSRAEPSLETLVRRELKKPWTGDPQITQKERVAQIIVMEMVSATEIGQRERRLYMEREWPAVRHLKITPDLPPEYPDLTALSDVQLRFTRKMLALARSANAIEVEGEHVLGTAVEVDEVSSSVVVAIDPDEEERHG